ncbi:unnamed protein product [Owenia fusiformis]|uniref:SAM domain-containing protein n=1 Tax=Owenia fusiformis TaxID=6347 RepID=A0A8S4QAH3_OWEFU|nr:unnamed protein product [Owenia fusiformis]
MNPENIALIPLNAEIEVQVATGFIGHPRADFYSYMGVLTDTLCQINFDNIKGQKDIMMVRDKTSAQEKLNNIALPTRSENIYETLEYVKLEGFSNPYEFTNLIPSSESGYVMKMAAPSIYEGRDSYLHIGTPVSTDNENDVTQMKAFVEDEKPNVPEAADEVGDDQSEDPHKGDNQSASDANIYDNSLKAESAPVMAELTKKMFGMRNEQNVAMVTELTQLIKKHDDSFENLPDISVKSRSPGIPLSNQQSPTMGPQSPNSDQISLTSNPQSHIRDPNSPFIDQTRITPHGSDTTQPSQAITQSNPIKDQQSPMISPQGSIIDKASKTITQSNPIKDQQSPMTSPQGSIIDKPSQTITQSNPIKDPQSPMTSPQDSIINKASKTITQSNPIKDQQSPTTSPIDQPIQIENRRSPIMTQQSLDSSSRTPPKPAPKPRVSKHQRASWPLQQQAPVIVEDERSSATPTEASQAMPETEDVTANIRPAVKPKPNFKNKKPSGRSPVYENVQILRSTKPVIETDTEHDRIQKMVVENEQATVPSESPSDDDYPELVKSTNQATGPHPGIHLDDQLHLDDVPRDLSSLSLQQVGQCLQQLNLENYIQVFAENLIDGDFLMSLDQSLLETEFKMGRLEVRRLMKFIKEGWRPKSDDGNKP